MTFENTSYDCIFLPCPICQMLRCLSREEHQFLQGMSTCQKCIENEELVLEVGKLQTIIKGLEERVTSLRNIRENETVIDQSIDLLTNQFDSLNVADTSKICVDDVASNVIVNDLTI